MELKGFYNDTVLNELLNKGEISDLEYIYHHSTEKIEDYKNFCQDKNLQEDEQSAVLFLTQ
jgi:hypothetical protein